MLYMEHDKDDVLILRVAGEEVKIMVRRVGKNTVRLAIDAPQSVEIERVPAPVGSEMQGAPEPEVFARYPLVRRR